PPPHAGAFPAPAAPASISPRLRIRFSEGGRLALLGYCTMTDRRVRPVPDRRELAGLPVLQLEVTEGRWALRRLDRGGRRLRRAGVRRVLTPAGFPHWGRLRALGLEPVEPWGLLRR